MTHNLLELLLLLPLVEFGNKFNRDRVNCSWPKIMSKLIGETLFALVYRVRSMLAAVFALFGNNALFCYEQQIKNLTYLRRSRFWSFRRFCWIWVQSRKKNYSNENQRVSVCVVNS